MWVWWFETWNPDHHREYENTWMRAKSHVFCQLDEGRGGGQPVVPGLHQTSPWGYFFVHSWVFCTLHLEIFTEVIKGKFSPHITSHFTAYSAAAISFQIKYKKIPLKPLTIYNWKKKQSKKTRFKSYVTMLVYSLVDKIKALHIHSLSNACLHFSSFSSFAAFLYLHQWTRWNYICISCMIYWYFSHFKHCKHSCMRKNLC